MLAWTN